MRRSVILETATTLLVPLLLLFSLFLLLRGHNAPGGGFSGGLVAAGAFGLYAFGRSIDDARAALGIPTGTLMGGGLLLAALSGIVVMAAGRPFLTGMWTSWDLPILGEVAVGTPLVFDVGVYLLVLGVSTTILFALGDE